MLKNKKIARNRIKNPKAYLHYWCRVKSCVSESAAPANKTSYSLAAINYLKFGLKQIESIFIIIQQLISPNFLLPNSKHVPSPGVRLLLSRFEARWTDAKKSLNGTNGIRIKKLKKKSMNRSHNLRGSLQIFNRRDLIESAWDPSISAICRYSNISFLLLTSKSFFLLAFIGTLFNEIIFFSFVLLLIHRFAVWQN